MKFGQVERFEDIDFKLPTDHKLTKIVLGGFGNKHIEICVGAPTWNKKNLLYFYPKGTKDELTYYSLQYNSIELNATYYSMPTVEKVLNWKAKTPESFKFFPKITNSISHYRRLINVTDHVTQFVTSIMHFEQQLGMVFMQLHDNFKPENIDRLEQFIKEWPEEIPLAIELRNEEWFNNPEVLESVAHLFQQYNITNILVDTPGRRDVLHMQLTTKTAFVRFVAVNDRIDEDRIADWVKRLKEWQQLGLENFYFFVHQNFEKRQNSLANEMISKINEELNYSLISPQLL